MRRARIVSIALIMLCVLLAGCSSKQSPYAQVPAPLATIEMQSGEVIRLQLFLQEAPNTVANFVELANAGFYDGLRFFRIVPGGFIQAGDPKNNGTGGAEHLIQGEFSENGIENNLVHSRGTISMCRLEDMDSASSQFFILQGDYPEFNGRYAAFGRALDADSLEAIDRIASLPVDSNYLPLGSMPTIKRIRVETYGYDYEAAKLERPEEVEEEKQK